MLAVTTLYELVASHIVPDFTINWYEFVGTWAGLVCVWLSRTQNILCWPWGIMSSITFGLFFAQIGLPGQQWLNLGYFLVIQIFAWPYWAFGGGARAKLPVTRLSHKGLMFTLFVLIFLTIVIFRMIDVLVPGSLYPLVDAVVVAASITAQYLLGRKVLESWWLWLGPVNLLSIVLFFAAGAYVVMALYIAFFVHAIIAMRTWKRELITRT